MTIKNRLQVRMTNVEADFGEKPLDNGAF